MWNREPYKTEEHPAEPLLPLASTVKVNYQQWRWLVARWVGRGWERKSPSTPHCQLTLAKGCLKHAQSLREAAQAPFQRSDSSAYLNEAKIVTGKRYQHHIPELELYLKIKWLHKQEEEKKDPLNPRLKPVTAPPVRTWRFSIIHRVSVCLFGVRSSLSCLPFLVPSQADLRLTLRQAA